MNELISVLGGVCMATGRRAGVDRCQQSGLTGIVASRPDCARQTGCAGAGLCAGTVGAEVVMTIEEVGDNRDGRSEALAGGTRYACWPSGRWSLDAA